MSTKSGLLWAAIIFAVLVILMLSALVLLGSDHITLGLCDLGLLAGSGLLLIWLGR